MWFQEINPYLSCFKVTGNFTWGGNFLKPKFLNEFLRLKWNFQGWGESGGGIYGTTQFSKKRFAVESAQFYIHNETWNLSVSYILTVSKHWFIFHFQVF